MSTAVQKRWGIFWVALFSALLGLAVVRAAPVDLDAWVEYSIMNSDGSAPLADGSWVYIIGSGNNTADPMFSLGTNYIGASVTGDDVILGVVQINLDSYSNGTFYTAVRYDSDEVDYVYIRFFDTVGALTGMLDWGQSAVYELGITAGVSTVDFGNNQASERDNFVVIPEPTTGNLIVLVAGMLWAMRARQRRDGDGDADGKKDGVK